MTVIWIVVVLAAAVIEIATQAMVSTWFVVGGLVAFVFSYLGLPIPLQLVAFFAVSIFSFAFIRRYLIPYTQTKFTPTNLDRMIGQEGAVTKEIGSRSRGEVHINAQYWTARCDDPERTLPVGSHVIIRAIEGATLIVSAIDED